MEIAILPALNTNYIYLISWNFHALAIDPGEAAPVLEALGKQKLTFRAILNTHHHSDHIDGNLAIKEQTGCSLIAPENQRIAGVDEIAHEGKDLTIDGLDIQVISVPGHTLTHVAYYIPETRWLFSGDTLFTGGCGRLFEGTAEQMLHSLHKLAMLPDQTKIFSGHEYTVNNLQFALSVEPDNENVRKRLESAIMLRSRKLPTQPSTLEEEKLTNPFLRAHNLKKALQMEQASDLEVFTRLRAMKDVF